MTLIPYAMTALAITVLVGLSGHWLGIGPVFGWAWDSLNAATAWWSKSLITAGMLAGAGGVIWLVMAQGKKLAIPYKYP